MQLLEVVGITHVLEVSPTLIQPPVTVSWLSFGLPPDYTPPMDNFAPQVRFGNVPSVVNDQPSFSHSKTSRDYHVGSTSNNLRFMAAFRQHIDESHHDLVNLLTQQMTTILNPIMADNETKYKHLARQVERIARIIDYDEGQPHHKNFKIDPDNLDVHKGNLRVNLDEEEPIPHMI
ncbi:hypothetical protein Ahy_A09g045213 [Arachis hypogaea]|uniref:Uncharacterized protein n=1 Tax=Arachis hypogaea TaxID=3818 RepID=A0A445BLU3_ARAHY|nr:hypothetical protein Ahy_A09g045213 [Arachis hypogaea]